jgi:hypothetical protein
VLVRKKLGIEYEEKDNAVEAWQVEGAIAVLNEKVD